MIRVFTQKSKTIVGAAIVLGIASLASRFLGLFRDAILARKFGAGDLLDVYLASFHIPDFIFNLLLAGVISAGFIPVFSDYLFSNSKDKKREAWEVASNLLNILLIVIAGVSVLAGIFAPWLIKFIVPGFSPEKMMQTVSLTRILLITPLFFTLSGIFGSILQTFRRFLAYAISPIFYNLGIIFGALYLANIFGPRGLAFGVVIGAFLHMAVQIPSIIAVGFRWHFNIYKLHPGSLKIILLVIPRTLSAGVAQIMALIMTIFASTLATGSLTIYRFADNLQGFATGLIGISFAMAAFPEFAKSVAQKNILKLGKDFSRIVGQVLFLILPASFLLLALKNEVVQIIFANRSLAHSAFDATSASLTSTTLQFFVFSIFAQSLMPLLIRVFFSLKKTLTPFVLGLISGIIGIIAAFFLKNIMGVPGLALAFSISSICQLVLLWFWLSKEGLDLKEEIISKTAFLVLVASFIAALIARLCAISIENFVGLNGFSYLAGGIGGGIVGVAVYLIVVYWMGLNEATNFFNYLKRKMTGGVVEN